MRSAHLAAWVLIAGLVACGSETNSEPAPEKAHESAGRGASPIGAAGSGIVIPTITVPEIPNLATVFMCNPDIENATSCGSHACAEVAQYMKDSCYVNCCTKDGRCGTRNTDPRFASVLGECTAPAVVDERCPSVIVGPVAFQGCCDAQNHCAAVTGPYCSSVLTGTLGMPVRDCDAAPASSGDAGM